MSATACVLIMTVFCESTSIETVVTRAQNSILLKLLRHNHALVPLPSPSPPLPPLSKLSSYTQPCMYVHVSACVRVYTCRFCMPLWHVKHLLYFLFFYLYLFCLGKCFADADEEFSQVRVCLFILQSCTKRRLLKGSRHSNYLSSHTLSFSLCMCVCAVQL